MSLRPSDEREPPKHEAIDYQVEDATAIVTLDRPDHHNTFVPPILDELADAVSTAVRDPVSVIVLQGAGRWFSGGFDFGGGFHHWDDEIAPDGRWDAGLDLIKVTSQEFGWVARFMSLWNSPKPVIAQVHGWCVGGASELALCADIVIAAEDARIGAGSSIRLMSGERSLPQEDGLAEHAVCCEPGRYRGSARASIAGTLGSA